MLTDGPRGPDDLRLGHLTQEWLATSEDPDAHTSGGCWHINAGRARIPPSVTGGSKTDCSTTSRFTATRLVSDPVSLPGG